MVLRDFFSIYSGDLWAAADPEYDDEPDQVPGGVGPLQMSGEPGELIEPHLGKFGHLLGEITTQAFVHEQSQGVILFCKFISFSNNYRMMSSIIEGVFILSL